MYTESIDVLKSVDRQKVTSHLILDYYTCFDHVYGEMGFYTQDQTLSAYYREISSAYKDSLYAILSPQSEEFMVMRETLFRDRHKYDEALEINDRRLMAAEPDTPQYALVTYHRSLIYKYLGDKIREKQNLCLSAISVFVLLLKIMLLCGCWLSCSMRMAIWRELTNICVSRGMLPNSIMLVFEVGRVPMCFL